MLPVNPEPPAGWTAWSSELSRVLLEVQELLLFLLLLPFAEEQ